MSKINRCGCGGKTELDRDGNILTVICECGNNSGQYFDFDIDYCIEAWNTAHPELSHAQEVVGWLEQGKVIKAKHFKNRVHEVRDGTVVCYATDKPNEYKPESDFGWMLMTHDWELYKKPKHSQISYEEAIISFTKFKKVYAVINNNEHKLVSISQKELVFDGLTISYKDTQFSNLITQENKWRIYD